MQNQKSSKNPYIILIIIVVIAGFAYFYLSGGSAAANPSLETNNVDEQIGTRVLSILNQVGSLKIDKRFFNDPMYLSLKDYTQTIPPQAVGRPNPFAPIPGMPISLKPTK